MKFIFSLVIVISLSSCIPVKIAPQIEDYTVKKGKRFKSYLPKEHTFIFNDPKKANEFNQFIAAKFGVENDFLEELIPIEINGKQYVLRYNEVERITKTINLIPFAIDAGLQSKNIDPLLEDVYTSRTGNWYIVISIANENTIDCLNPEFKNQSEIVASLKKLKDEYLNTSNYLETLMKR